MYIQILELLKMIGETYKKNQSSFNIYLQGEGSNILLAFKKAGFICSFSKGCHDEYKVVISSKSCSQYEAISSGNVKIEYWVTDVWAPNSITCKKVPGGFKVLIIKSK